MGAPLSLRVEAFLLSPRTTLAALALLALVAPVGAAPAPAGSAAVDWTSLVSCGEDGAHAVDAPDPSNPLLRVHVEAYCVEEEASSFGVASLTDCARTTYLRKPWRWAVPYIPKVNVSTMPSDLVAADVVSSFQAALDTWDDAVLVELTGTITTGGNANHVGVLDGNNLFAWKALTSGVIAVTTTWYYDDAQLALESDAAYNTAYSWSTSGAASAFDLQHIATHEVGHSVGLGDLYASADSCLTMYGYGSTGDTHARTLGDGDLLGVRATYGA